MVAVGRRLVSRYRVSMRIEEKGDDGEKIGGLFVQEVGFTNFLWKLPRIPN